MTDRPLFAGSLRDSPRNAFECAVILRFPDRQRPVNATLKDLSATGMFIRSRDARPAGSNLSFELSLDDGGQPIHGEGQVVWTRRFELGQGHPAGMGIRFLDLEQGGDRALRSFLAGSGGSGGRPFDSNGDRSAAGRRVAGPPARAYGGPLNGLTSSQLGRLYSYAGSAAARPDRGWGRGVSRLLSRLARAAGRVLRRRPPGS